MKRSRARGNNEITSEALKETPQFLSICMTHLINCMMRQGAFPECMKTSRIITILKPGKPTDLLDSFRPVNNLNPVEKIIEEAIKIQVEEYLDRMKVIPNELHGARKAHNTLTAKLRVDENINTMRNKN